MHENNDSVKSLASNLISWHYKISKLEKYLLVGNSHQLKITALNRWEIPTGWFFQKL